MATAPSAGSNEPHDEELDASIAVEVDDANTNAIAEQSSADAMNVDKEDATQTETQDANASASTAAPATGNAEGAAAAATADGIPESRIPQQKDETLRQFLGKVTNEYSPIFPDSCIDYYMTLGGLPPPPETPRPLARLIALATQKFMSDIAADAYQYARIRSSNTSSNNPMNLSTTVPGAAGAAPGGAAGGATGGGGDKAGGSKAANLGQPRPGYGGGGQGGAQGRTVLTMEDLGQAVAEYGINVKRGEWFR